MTVPPSFRFGVVSSARTTNSWADTARSVEGHGYSTMLVPDTLWTPSPFPVLANAAAATTTLRLGTWVLSAPLRTPAEVVRETKTLQEVSAGRFELGLGAGRPGGDSDAATLGADWGSAGSRVDRVEATAAAVHAGVPPIPAIVLAASGPRMLRIAGRFAATVALPVPPTADIELIRVAAERVRAIARADIEIAFQVVGVGDDVPLWSRRQLGMTTQSLRDARAAGLLSGDVDRDTDALEALRSITGVSYLTVPGEFADRLAPLVQRLGAPAEAGSNPN